MGSLFMVLALLLLTTSAVAQVQGTSKRDWGDGVSSSFRPDGTQSCAYAKATGPSSGFAFLAGDQDDGPLTLGYVEKGADLEGGAATFQVDNHPPIHSDANPARTPGMATIVLTDREAIGTLAQQLFLAHTIRVATKAGLRSFPAGPDVFRGFLTMMYCKSYIVGFADGKQAATKSK
jgi:hypothetical protein